MTTYASIHNVKQISARAQGSLGAPVTLSLIDDAGAEVEVTFYTDRLPLSRRIAEAINDVVKPKEPTEFLLVSEIVDALQASDCPLDEARAVLRAALSQYENRMEDAYQRRQEQLAESGGSDDSAYRRDLINAGRGHLLP